MNRNFTYFVLGALFLGVLAGVILHKVLPDAALIASVSDYLTIITDVFLRLIKMIIAPLVFSTLVSGIAHMKDSAAIGRIGVKTLVWFLGASIVSLVVGLVLVQLLHPGAGLGLHVIDKNVSSVDTSTLTAKDFVAHLVPTSIVDAMARNEILQIVVFSVLIGMAMVALGERAAAHGHALGTRRTLAGPLGWALPRASTDPTAFVRLAPAGTGSWRPFVSYASSPARIGH